MMEAGRISWEFGVLSLESTVQSSSRSDSYRMKRSEMERSIIDFSTALHPTAIVAARNDDQIKKNPLQLILKRVFIHFTETDKHNIKSNKPD
jgi:hypothetical protein